MKYLLVFILTLWCGTNFINGQQIGSEHSCVCPYIWSPVCGDDGKTYPSLCSLQCVPGVKFVHNGECPVPYKI